MSTLTRVALLPVLILTASISFAQTEQHQALKVDQAQVDAWNSFADALRTVHDARMAQHKVRTTERIGGYGGSYLGDPAFYREVKYFDAESGKLLSRIQWERQQPDVIHMIEVLFYDDKGRVERDYLAAYLPRFRNAPIQTLINFHRYEDGVHGFRQFDASGNRIYEQCQGTYFGEKVFLSLDESDLPPFSNDPELFDSHVYLACFEHLPLQARAYLDPLAELGRGEGSAVQTDVQTNQEIERLSRQIETGPSPALYIRRGQARFDTGDMDAALDDFDSALRADPKAERVHFWRGMVLGRMGRLDDAIKALDRYLQHYPNDSVAYTKRGVRHIWNGDLGSAERDLKQAIALDPKNAEAHDDLGVIYAQREAYDTALSHFDRTVAIDPSYQKGHHNRAIVLYLTGNLDAALRAVNESHRLAPTDRNTVMLKGQILTAMGQSQQAQALFERAQFMAEDKDWTEQFTLQQ